MSTGVAITGESEAPAAVSLSPRQRLCLQRVALGETSVEIAAALQLSVSTVDQYVAEACLRLNVRTRASAVAAALNLGLIQI